MKFIKFYKNYYKIKMELTTTEIKKKLREKHIPFEKDAKKRELLTLLYPHPFNIFFDKVYIINLKDKVERWEKVSREFENRGILYERFNAIDGRAKTEEIGEEKKRKFKQKYHLRIVEDLQAPPVSLVIGNYLILKQALEKGYKHVLICEDDITFGEDIEREFVSGIIDLLRLGEDWDILYLGCANRCGIRGISRRRTEENKYITDLNREDKKLKWYVQNEFDIRQPCPDCRIIANNITEGVSPTGTFGYAFSESGMKKLTQLIKKYGIWEHIDQIVKYFIDKGKLRALAFDPPLIWHLEALRRPDTDIPWD